MPPLVLLAVVGAAGYAGFKLFSKLVEQAQTPSKSDTERARQQANAARGAATAGTRDLGELELDEKTGVYKPKNGA
jgi:N-acetyl-gamma-glutamylphosphate reductase